MSLTIPEQSRRNALRSANFTFHRRAAKDEGRFVRRLFLAMIATLSLAGSTAHADFSNYNSVLIGDRAAGMGGAFTALSGDPAACSFYNPATLSQVQGSSFSASATLYNKYDTSFSDAGNLQDSALKLNRGAFQGIPASAGSAISFGTFALGLSILTPDYDAYSGDIQLSSFPNSTTFVDSKDQSLWVGGNLAVNFTDNFSAGFTFYYTSRNYQRATTEQTITGGNTQFYYENKTFTSNNLVYILGAFYRINERLTAGLSYRLPSIQIAGDGSYYSSTLDTSVSNVPTTQSRQDIQARTHIPSKIALGLAYDVPKKLTLSADMTYYTSDSYQDLIDPIAGETISYQEVINYAIGAEYYFRTWLSLRAGVFTNYSSHTDIKPFAGRQGDHIDMLGFSTNVGLYSGKTSFTFGGYFTGGRGQSTQPIQESIVATPKVEYIYSLLIATSYYF